MRKFLLIFAVLIVTVLIAADFKSGKTTASLQATHPKKPCYGYSIIEFGKGINCNGDTVKLVKVNGGQELLRETATDQLTISAD